MKAGELTQAAMSAALAVRQVPAPEQALLLSELCASAQVCLPLQQQSDAWLSNSCTASFARVASRGGACFIHMT